MLYNLDARKGCFSVKDVSTNCLPRVLCDNLTGITVTFDILLKKEMLTGRTRCACETPPSCKNTRVLYVQTLVERTDIMQGRARPDYSNHWRRRVGEGAEMVNITYSSEIIISTKPTTGLLYFLTWTLIIILFPDSKRLINLLKRLFVPIFY